MRLRTSFFRVSGYWARVVSVLDNRDNTGGGNSEPSDADLMHYVQPEYMDRLGGTPTSSPVSLLQSIFCPIVLPALPMSSTGICHTYFKAWASNVTTWIGGDI